MSTEKTETKPHIGQSRSNAAVRRLNARQITPTKVAAVWAEPLSIAGKKISHEFRGATLFEVQVAAKSAGCALPIEMLFVAPNVK